MNKQQANRDCVGMEENNTIEHVTGLKLSLNELIMEPVASLLNHEVVYMNQIFIDVLQILHFKNVGMSKRK